MSGANIISQFVEFIQELVRSLDEGYLFFGSFWDVVRYIADITLVAFMFYWILIFVRQTRAWQLIKGILMILVAVLICVIAGLDMVGYIFNRLLYVFAFLFIVLFQPELRRVLETVGVRSSGSIKGIFKLNDKTEKSEVSTFIHEVCSACSDMAKSYTGALIIIERNTKLDELLTRENAVRYESTVTSSVLQSIFYKGAPMHDGGLLIRDGMIIGARCHLPLAETMHNLERAGTRHRAAVGASEMGDTIAVVVSEERGTISVAVNGILYEMKDATELELNLSYLLGILDVKDEKKGFGKLISRVKKDKSNEKANQTSDVKIKKEDDDEIEAYKVKTKVDRSSKDNNQIQIGTRIAVIAVSIFLSLLLWVYIQINNNPVISKTIYVPIEYDDETKPNNIEVSYPIDTVEIEVVGRKETISNLTAKDVSALIDYSNLDISKIGVVELPVEVAPSSGNIYFRVERQLPETVSITVYSVS